MKCPTCKKPAVKAANRYYPFCCERCHLVDLGRWLGEEYRVPVDDATPTPTPPATDDGE